MHTDNFSFNPEYPSIAALRQRARRRIPKFAFDYLEGGCNEHINLRKNVSDLEGVELIPRYIQDLPEVSMDAKLFGIQYSAPFGIAPIGLQGLIWPNSPEILAGAAFQHNLPFILSTVSTASIERIAEITEGRSWFQLYHPSDESLTTDLIERLEAAEISVLVILADVPTFGFRPNDIRNGLSMPPKMNFRNLLHISRAPIWALRTMTYGIPRFASLKPYMNQNINLREIGEFMDKTFDGRLTKDRIAWLRDKWKGTLVVKGVASEEDAEMTVRLGIDGIIVSNHGGRQLDAGQSSITALRNLAAKFGHQTEVMMDGGIRSGPDVARAIASGARFSFLGRAFMYGVGALGSNGGHHTISLLKAQLKQLLEQIGCPEVRLLPTYLA